MGIQGPKVIRDYEYHAWSLTLPEPLAFPREPFADVLEEHVRIFDAQKTALLDSLREASTSEEPHLSLTELTAIVEIANDKPDATIKVGSRGEAATYFHEYRGVLRLLLDRPLGQHVYVVIAQKGVLSLHLAEVTGFETQRYALVMARREIAFEPSNIKNRECGSGAPFVVTEWRHKGVRRYAWSRVPPDPATDDDAIDRYIVREGARIRDAMAAFTASHPGQWPVAMAMCTREYGDAMEVLDRRDFAGMGAEFPRIAKAASSTNDMTLLPVVVCIGLRAGLRWLQLTRDDRALPPSFIEDANLPIDELARPFFEAARPKPQPKEERPRKKMSDGELIRFLAFEMGIHDEIDVHLVQMTREEIDHDLTTAGFDPAVEHSSSWLRHEVIDALSDLERDDSRFWDEHGELRTKWT